MSDKDEFENLEKEREKRKKKKDKILTDIEKQGGII